MSATVLVDNVYVARMMRGARHSARLKRNNAAKIFGITQRQLARYESGKVLIPEHILEKLFYYGFVMMSANQRNNKVQ